MSTSAGSARLSLEDLAALNDEICSLAKAGVPLELGLPAATAGLSRRVVVLSDRLAARLAEGHSLEEAIAAEGDTFPPAYRALVAVGVKTGRLDHALGSLSTSARSLESLWQQIHMSLLYPFQVLVMAFVVLLSLRVAVWPRLFVFGMEFSDSLVVSLWLLVVPLVILLVALFWRASPRWLLWPVKTVIWHPGRLLSVLPWIGRILANYHRAAFTELLGLLLEQGIALTEAVPLAIDASGDRRLAARRQLLVQHLEAGGRLGEFLQDKRVATPFLSWMMIAAERRGALVPALKQAASILRRRAAFQAEWFQVVFPAAAVVMIGGGAVLCTSLSVFAPLVRLLNMLAYG